MKWTKSFLDYLRYERNDSVQTIVAYGEDLSQFEEFVCKQSENLSLENVDSNLVREWEMSLMNAKYSSASVNRKLSTLRAFYKFLLRKGVITSDPLGKVIGPKKKKPLPVFLKEKEINELLDDVDFGKGFSAVRDHLIIEMFYLTGMRRAELIGLQDGDVDVSSQTIKVNGKRNKQRLIPFGEELKDAIEQYVKLRDESVCRMDQSFFVDEKGKPLYPVKVYHIVKENLSKVVTLKKRSPHVLRHTFATAMLNHDATLSAVKELLGHSSLATTQIYTHTTFEELKKAYKQAHPRA